MNDDTMREQAHERLLTAELAAVMVSERPRAAATWQPFYVAAMVVLGAFVAVGIAWLAPDDRAPAQGRVFDAVDPWYEHEWPWRSMVSQLMKPGRAAEAPEGVDEFVVTLRDEDSGDLAAVLDRPAVRRLSLSWRNDKAVANVAPDLWQRLVTRPDLEVLMLSGRFAMPADRLRDLRLAPALRYVLLLEGAATLDLPTARALVELTRVRGLTLGNVDLTIEGIEALAGLPDLDVLLLSRPRLDVHDLMQSLTKLRGLRALVLQSDDASVDAAALRPLAGMKHLRALEISLGRLDDAALAALPPQLEHLSVDLDACTGGGLGHLRRLKGLRRLRLGGIPAPLQRAFPGVLRDLPLERYDALAATPDAATWQALQSLPKLHWLTIRRQSDSFAHVVAGVRLCQHLEVLELFEKVLPTPEQLAPLRDHPTLRRIVFRQDDLGSAIPFQVEQLEALRASVRAQIELIER